MQPKWSFTFTKTPDFNLALLLGASALASRLWRACFWCFCNIYRSNNARVRNTYKVIIIGRSNLLAFVIKKSLYPYIDILKQWYILHTSWAGFFSKLRKTWQLRTNKLFSRRIFPQKKFLIFVGLSIFVQLRKDLVCILAGWLVNYRPTTKKEPDLLRHLKWRPWSRPSGVCLAVTRLRRRQCRRSQLLSNSPLIFLYHKSFRHIWQFPISNLPIHCVLKVTPAFCK